MRSINQSREPAELRKWKRENSKAAQNLKYKNIPGDVLEAIKKSLLREQNGLCAYSMQRLTGVDACHVEHIEPQGHNPEKDIDYSNLAACFPTDGGDISHGYGAPVKGGKAVRPNEDFVSPHSNGCEKRFVFSWDGKVHSAPADTCASKTIKLLKLDHPALAELRQRAIATHGLTLSQRNLRIKTQRLTISEAKTLSRRILQPDTSNQLEPFCVAISQVATLFAQNSQKRSKRVRGAKRS
ncbi:MAG: TIGR02646 family protein [Thiobacillus sp.]|nr:TIGR02646 family protein [Thiobacillus sp.]